MPITMELPPEDPRLAPSGGPNKLPLSTSWFITVMWGPNWALLLSLCESKLV